MIQENCEEEETTLSALFPRNRTRHTPHPHFHIPAMIYTNILCVFQMHIYPKGQDAACK